MTGLGPMTTTRDGTDPVAGTAAPAPGPRPDEQAAEPLTSGLPQLARLLGTVVAPTTLLTSLLFYFGWSHAYYFYDYFGVTRPCSASPPATTCSGPWTGCSSR
jgi:hypothetical protein